MDRVRPTPSVSLPLETTWTTVKLFVEDLAGERFRPVTTVFLQGLVTGVNDCQTPWNKEFLVYESIA